MTQLTNPNETNPQSASRQKLLLGGLAAIGLAAAIIVLALFLSDNSGDSKEASIPTLTATPGPTDTPTATASPTITPSPTVTPTPTATPIPPLVFLTRLHSSSWLETARGEYSIPDIFGDTDRGTYPGRNELHLAAFFDLTAGVDLELITEDDFELDGSKVTIALPPPQVRECIYNAEKSFYYDDDCSKGPGLCEWSGCHGLEDEVQRRARELVLEATHDDLLKRARDEAADALENLFEGIGVTEVRLIEKVIELPIYSEGGTCAAIALELQDD